MSLPPPFPEYNPDQEKIDDVLNKLKSSNKLKEFISEKLTAHTFDQEKENATKYGDKMFDVISDAYRLSKNAGDIYCAYNAIKYLRRYVSQSKKAGNAIDLRKTIDYIERMLQNSQEKPEVIE